MARRPSNNFQFYRGDTKVFSLSFNTGDGAPVNITGHELWFTMKRDINDLDSDAIIQKKHVFPQGEHSEAGIGSLVLESSETGGFEPGLYLYDMQKVIVGTPPVVSTLLSGRINILPDVTQTNGT